MAEKNNARLATLDQLIETTVPAFLNPVPPRRRLKVWLDRARVPRFKSNPAATRGGGEVYYSVADVEKLFRNRIFQPA